MQTVFRLSHQSYDHRLVSPNLMKLLNWTVWLEYARWHLICRIFHYKICVIANRFKECHKWSCVVECISYTCLWIVYKQTLQIYKLDFNAKLGKERLQKLILKCSCICYTDKWGLVCDLWIKSHVYTFSWTANMRFPKTNFPSSICTLRETCSQRYFFQM